MKEERMSSELGTLEYWESSYSTELENFKDHGDVGEIWFGKESSKRIIDYINRLQICKQTDKVIDIGCGNGMTLVDFAKNQFLNLTGVDYSQKAINLTQEILKNKGFDNIELKVLDITSPLKFKDTYKIVHDKGTYDAISLDPSDSIAKRESYKKNVYDMLQENGFLILTSCNWTTNELISDFEKFFELKQEIPVKTIVFGGIKGQTISQLILEKKSMNSP